MEYKEVWFDRHRSKNSKKDAMKNVPEHWHNQRERERETETDTKKTLQNNDTNRERDTI